MTTLRGLAAGARRQLADAGIASEEAAFDAEVLARAVLGWDRAQWLARAGDAAPSGFEGRFAAAVARRAARVPVSQILGRREFRGLDLEVSAQVLTPRPETEGLADECLARLADARRAWRVADVGTGSGCVAIALAVERPAAQIVATDVSEPALDVARQNAARHGVSARVRFVRTSILDGIGGPFDLVASNPPYIPTGDLPALPPEVRDHEPRAALDGGADGLDVVRALLEGAGPALTGGGWLVFEIGAGEDGAARALVDASPSFEWAGVRPDLAGIPRVVLARSTLRRR